MNDVLFRVECREPTGIYQRAVRELVLDEETLSDLWEKLSKFPTLFNNHIKTLDDFVNAFVDFSGGEIKARGLVWAVDDVGILFITDIYPGFQASAHFTFWDRTFNGREELIRQMIRYVFEEFGFHRLIAEVPLYSRPTLQAAEKVGFVKEGRMRKFTWYKGQWWDVNLYSVLREEVVNNGIPAPGDHVPAAEVAGDTAG
jgi:RimJ/RimL family protein N-acetyltransferase